MDRKQKRQTLEELLIQFNDLKPDLQKFGGDPVSALAERLIVFINKLTPHSHLFEDSFKQKIKNYILVYEETRKNPSKSTTLPMLIKPTSDQIKETLEKKIIELS